MSRLKANIVANLAGTGSQALVQLICAPLYVKLLGIDAYGLVGFFMTLQASLKVLDLGLSPTMNRQMARYSVQPEKSEEARDFVRTLEVLYWLLGIVVGAAISMAAPLIATHWIKPGRLPVVEVQRAVVLMGAVVAVQWPLSIYQGGLMGLQRQVDVNTIRIIAATAIGGGAALVLWWVSPTVSCFFIWQAFTTLAYVVAMGVALWRNLPRQTRRARFDLRCVRIVMKFAGGMSVIAVAGATLAQMDKIILSRLLPLDLFGYYTLAALIASSLQLFSAPLFNALFPRVSALVAQGAEGSVSRVYHECSQLMAVLIFPLALELCLFAPEVLRVWTGSDALALHGAPIVQFLVAGTAINGIMFLPYSIQLANGWTSLPLTVSVGMCVVMVPAVYFMAAHFGGPGAASVWLAVNVLNLAIAFPLTHRRFLRGEAGRWLGVDMFRPLAGAAAITLLAHAFLPTMVGRIPTALELLVVLAAAYLAAMVCAPRIRGWSFEQLRLMTSWPR